MLMKNKKKIFTFFLILFIGSGLFFLAPNAYAGGEWAGEIIGTLIGWIIAAIGLILALVLKALVLVAQYSNFIASPAVTNGWVIVRDLCNMFFVLILLIIAFATILGIEKYNYKKWLPKLILMAILINFSKTICGVLIDFAQVIMLTFVNAFKDIAAGNLISNLGLTNIMTLAKSEASVGFWQIVGAYVLGLIYIIIALVVVTTMLAILVMRIVMLWIYIVLSPLAYLLASFPDGAKYSSQWWSEFTKNLIVGPVLAFFIWLSFTSMQAANWGDGFGVGQSSTADLAKEVGINANQSGGPTGTEASSPEVFIKFVISIGLLIGGLKISQEIGSVAGGIAGKGMATLNKGQAFVKGKATGIAKKGVTGAAKGVGRGALGLTALASKKAGVALGESKLGESKFFKRTSEAMVGTGNIGLAWRQDLISAKKKAKVEKREKFLKKIGMGEGAMEKTDEFLKTDTGKRLSASLAGASVGAMIGGSTFGGLGTAVGTAVGFGTGGLVSFLSGKFAEKAGRDIAGHRNEASNLQAQADNARRRGDIAEADRLEKEANKERNKANFLENTIEKPFKDLQAFASLNIQKAAANGVKKIKQAKDRVKALANDEQSMQGDDGFETSVFYSKSGQTDAQKEFFKQLTNPDNKDSGPAIANIIKWLNNPRANSKKDTERKESLMRGIAAFEKGGNDVSRLGGVISALNSQKLSIGTYEGQKGKVIPNRKTGAVGQQGSGELAINTFANNLANEAGKDIIGVDFRKMTGSGLDVDAEASFVSGEAVAPVVAALKNQINAERNSLNNQHANGEIAENEFRSRQKDLEKAEARLDAADLKNIQLVNTGGANYGRQERLASVYHEEIHRGGVEDEDLTERMAKSLLENKLYGRNAETKGRHATEIAQLAKAMKEQGRDNDDIMKEIESEIKSRVASEGKNKAERVLKLENGEKETVSSVIDEKAAATPISLDTKELQQSLETMIEKMENLFSQPRDSSVKTGSSEPDIFKLIAPLKQIRDNAKENFSYMRSLSKLVGNKMPDSVQVINAVNQKMNE